MSNTPNLKSARLILASASPRRRELLAGLERPFEVIVPDIDETPRPREAPASYVLRMAFEKAQAVFAGLQPDVQELCLIAADTTVVLGDRMLGKPADVDEATVMLQSLSGNSHNVITGLCVWTKDESGEHIRGEAVSTSVTFRKVSEAEIHHYAHSGEPMDKAGAYAIQGGAAGMVDHLDGSYTNVVGLPMETLIRLLGER